MSLYRKYRPQTFSHLVGQEQINRTLLNALKLDRVSHAYLFTGPRGTGKTSTARLMAKAINCLSPEDNEPCNGCEICTEINEGRLIDLIEIDAASNRGIDEIRELRDKIVFAPSRAKSKVYIIDEVHMLTKEAFNALLKTLEEPPAHVYFILATTEAHKIPETILSRCQRFDFRRIDDAALMQRLRYIAGEEGIEAEEKALELIAHHAEGGMRDAIGLLEQLSTDKKLSFDRVCSILGVGGVASMEKLWEALKEGDAAAGLKIIAGLHAEGFDLLVFNKRFLEFLRKRMIASVEKADFMETERILAMINNFREAYEQARFTIISQLPLEMAVVKSCRTTGISSAGEVHTAATAGTNAGATAEKMAATVAGKNGSDAVLPVSVATTTPNTTEPVSPGQPAQAAVPDRTHQQIETRPAGAQTPVSLEQIISKWNELEKFIAVPAAKRCAQQGHPCRLEGNTLVISFTNKFSLDKMMETANRTEVEKAVYEMTGANLKITGEVSAAAAEAERAGKELEEKVLDIFEGRAA